MATLADALQEAMLGALAETRDPGYGEVLEFVRGLRTWLTPEGQARQGEPLTFSTRDHGDVGEESPGREDIAEARRIAVAIRKQFPSANVELDVVDEWVSVHVDFGAKRYKSEDLAAALKKAFPSAGKILKLGGTFEIAMTEVPQIGAARLISGSKGVFLDRNSSLFGHPSSKAVALKSLSPSSILAAASKEP